VFVARRKSASFDECEYECELYGNGNNNKNRNLALMDGEAFRGIKYALNQSYEGRRKSLSNYLEMVRTVRQWGRRG